ncbi:hypothetical protein [Kitasatospora sp. NPDC094011]|uniref:hypothetical protein n=1 Tax=Kitasatospora sp. NPDC094011 TaxID=3364090 RepID=UPI0037FD23C1
MSAAAKRDVPKSVQKILAEDDASPVVAELVSALAPSAPAIPRRDLPGQGRGRLSRARDARLRGLREDLRLGRVTLTIVDEHVNDKAPEEHSLLKAALQNLKDQKAGAILVPSRATITPIDGEYNDFAEVVEKAGGFIQVATRR